MNMEEKEIINEEETNLEENKDIQEEENAPVEEENIEKKLNSAIEITKPQEGDKPYGEIVEEERKAIISQNKKSTRLSTISIVIVLALSVTGIIFLQSIPVLSYSLMGGAVATLIVFSIITHRIARPDVKGYIVKASTAINRYTFADTRFSEVRYDPNDKIELGDVFSDGVFEGLVRIASRNVVEGKFENRSFKVCECALFNPNEGKKQSPAFIGKYLTFSNDLHFEGRIVFVIKGEKDYDVPNGLGDLMQVENDGHFFAYAPNEEAFKELNSKFIARLKKTEITGHLLNLTVVLWSGRSIVYASYDDETITLPFYEEYKPDTAVQYRKDLVEILETLQMINKE